jgi:ABC-2 type transport system ATP-binding protein
MIATVDGVSRLFDGTAALDGVSFALRENTIYGLLGRNGAGKTTLMQILTGQQFASAGTVEVMGAEPAENDAVLAQVCFVRENLRYPDWFRVRHALSAAAALHPHWDEAFAQSLVDEFRLPRARPMKKLSRGMLSTVGVIVGLASRAPLTLFDEPYLGLDAVARQLFYDRLLADYVEHPRTVVLSTHLIDEVADLVEHVLLLDRGRLMVDETTERLRGQVVTVTGPAEAVDRFVATHEVLHRSTLGSTVRATVRAAVEPSVAAGLGLVVEPLSLQQLVVSLTTPSKGGSS